MLAANRLVAFAPETKFYLTYIVPSSKRSALESRGLEKFATILRKDKKFSRLGLDLGDLLSVYKREFGSKLDLAHFYQCMLTQYAEQQQKRFFGDKDPKLLEYVHCLVNDFPRAKIIHIVRDPRDVIVSRMKADWSKRYVFLLQAMVCSVQLRKGLRKASELSAAQYMEIAYEDLLRSPKVILRRVCEFIGVPFDVNMIQYQSAAKKLVSQDELQWKAATLGPLLTQNTGKWKEELTRFQVLVTERLCIEGLERFSYERSITDVSAFERYCLALLVFSKWVFARIYELRR